MSGGSWEYMAAYISKATKDDSGFQPGELEMLDAKYFDVYETANTITDYDKMILGDATGEVGPFDNYKDGDGSSRWHSRWYDDLGYFAFSSSPWFRRSDGNGEGYHAGQFFFASHTGEGRGGDAFRITLAPSNKSA